MLKIFEFKSSGVQGFGLGFQGLGLRVFRTYTGLRPPCFKYSGFRDRLGFRVYGSGFRV